jgi:GNAT superfamily N-acetyltransferase
MDTVLIPKSWLDERAAMNQLTVRPISPSDDSEWLRMRIALWPDHSPADLEREMKTIAAPSDRSPVFVAQRPNGQLGGFLEANLRSHAQGCITSPVAYIEGWYVDPDVRRIGLGKRLVEAAEAWARSLGCTEIASDCDLDNAVSLAAHTALGYAEEGRNIHFRKSFPSPHDSPSVQSSRNASAEGDITIRTAREDELQEILQLYQDLNPEDPLLSIDPDLQAHWQTMLATPNLHLIVAEVAGEIVSSCTLCIIPNLTRSAKPYALIENVVTRAAHRGKGYATAVLQFAQNLAWSRRCYKIMLMTGSRQEKTLQFYDNAGFSRGTKTAFIARAPSAL